eukprot:822489_1
MKVFHCIYLDLALSFMRLFLSSAELMAEIKEPESEINLECKSFILALLFVYKGRGLTPQEIRLCLKEPSKLLREKPFGNLSTVLRDMQLYDDLLLKVGNRYMLSPKGINAAETAKATLVHGVVKENAISLNRAQRTLNANRANYSIFPASGQVLLLEPSSSGSRPVSGSGSLLGPRYPGWGDR